MQLFYAPDLNEGDAFAILSREESHHAIKVLRMQAGDEMFVTNGRGLGVRGTLSDPSPSGCSVRIEDALEDTQKRGYRIHVAVAPTKVNDRMEWFLEKATEIGVDEITPLICARSERRVFNHARGSKVVLSAAKQSLKYSFPVLNEAEGFKTFLKGISAGKKFIAHCMPEGRRLSLKDGLCPGDDVCILIGPEGDFSPEEVRAAVDCGFVPVTLGTSRLRTETAALFAVAMACTVNM